MELSSASDQLTWSSFRQGLVAGVLGPGLGEMAFKKILERLEIRSPDNRLVQLVSEQLEAGALTTSPTKRLLRTVRDAIAERNSASSPQTGSAGMRAETMTDEQADEAVAGARELMEFSPEQMMTDQIDDEMVASIGVDSRNVARHRIAIGLISFFFVLITVVGVANGVPGAEDWVGDYEDHLAIALSLAGVTIAILDGRRQGWTA